MTKFLGPKFQFSVDVKLSKLSKLQVEKIAIMTNFEKYIFQIKVLFRFRSLSL